MRDLIQRYGLALSITFAGLAAFWLLMLVIFPYVFLGEQSFRPYLPVAQIGGPNDNYTLSNYITFFTSPIHVHVFLLTVFFSAEPVRSFADARACDLRAHAAWCRPSATSSACLLSTASPIC